MSILDGILDLTIKKYWFNVIKSGKKTHEYRNTATWSSKLGGKKKEKYHTIRFRQGQTIKSTDKNNVIYAKILSISITDGKNTDLNINHEVFDIKFELIK